jgi:sterol desaturase/sphingolipid hydroxylase (fatty acid hydroxylase superfamily)
MVIAVTVLPAVRLFATTAAFVALIEMLRPAQTGAGVRARAENIAVFALNVAAFGLVLEWWPWLFSLVGRWGLMDLAAPSRFHNTVLGVVVTTLVYAVVWDFFQYWAHRVQHEWRVLWPMHSVHHSDRCMNATTAGRQSIASTLFGYAAIHVPTMFVVGPTLLTVVGATVLFNGWGYLNHANVRLPFGRATVLLSGPQLHRMHHGVGDRYRDSNYAAFFPVLDRMFGTLVVPEPNEWPGTGIIGGARPLSVSVFWPWAFPWRRRAARAPALASVRRLLAGGRTDGADVPQVAEVDVDDGRHVDVGHLETVVAGPADGESHRIGLVDDDALIEVLDAIDDARRQQTSGVQ